MDGRLDPTEKVAEPIATLSFEGIPVTGIEGTLPSVQLDMPEGYPVGTHLRFEVEVRIANVHHDEGKGRKRADFIRRHVFAVEEVTLKAAFIPGEAASAPLGNLAGSEHLTEPEEPEALQEAPQTLTSSETVVIPLPDYAVPTLEQELAALTALSDASIPVEDIGF